MNFRAIKLKMIRFCLFSLLLLLTSCYGLNNGAGYSVRINLDKHAAPTTNDLGLITEYLDQAKYEIVKKNSEKNWGVESFKIFLDSKEFDKLEHRYIMIVAEYYLVNQSASEPKRIEKIEIRIGNTREGSTPLLKKEIDLVADSILEKLVSRFGTEHISIERKIVTPM